MPKVLVLGGNPGDDSSSVIKMFHQKKWDVTCYDGARGVDLVVFCGGTDVNPAIYGEAMGPYTQTPDTGRDRYEVLTFKTFINIPKVGICRGAQLLNVLSGGKMIQHIGYGYSGVVKASIWPSLINGAIEQHTITVDVDHHQGMVYGADCEPLAWYNDDVGCIHFYESTKSLCFQPHPEWGHDETRELFFELIQQHLGVS